MLDPIASAVLFALALLCAGESAGITATLAGQVVSEGFIRWRLPVGFLSSSTSIYCLTS